MILYLLSKTRVCHRRVRNLAVIETVYLRPTVAPGDFDALVLTSKEAITALQKAGCDLSGLQALCVSEKTAAKAAGAGMVVLDSAGGYGKELGALIADRYRGLSLYFPRAAVLAYDLPGFLQSSGIDITADIVYKTRCAPKEAVSFENNSVFLFTSPSTVRCFFQNYTWQPGFKAVAIGKTTFDSLPKECEAYIAEKTDIDACIDKGLQL